VRNEARTGRAARLVGLPLSSTPSRNSKVGLVFLIHIGLLLLDCGLGSRLRLSILAHVCRSWSLGAVYCDPCSGCNQEMSQLISSCKSLASENKSAKTVACPGPRKKEKAREKGR